MSTQTALLLLLLALLHTLLASSFRVTSDKGQRLGLYRAPPVAGGGGRGGGKTLPSFILTSKPFIAKPKEEDRYFLGSAKPKWDDEDDEVESQIESKYVIECSPGQSCHQIIDFDDAISVSERLDNLDSDETDEDSLERRDDDEEEDGDSWLENDWRINSVFGGDEEVAAQLEERIKKRKGGIQKKHNFYSYQESSKKDSNYFGFKSNSYRRTTEPPYVRPEYNNYHRRTTNPPSYVREKYNNFMYRDPPKFSPYHTSQANRRTGYAPPKRQQQQQQQQQVSSPSQQYFNYDPFAFHAKNRNKRPQLRQQQIQNEFQRRTGHHYHRPAAPLMRTDSRLSVSAPSSARDWYRIRSRDHSGSNNSNGNDNRMWLSPAPDRTPFSQRARQYYPTSGRDNLNKNKNSNSYIAPTTSTNNNNNNNNLPRPIVVSSNSIMVTTTPKPNGTSDSDRISPSNFIITSSDASSKSQQLRSNTYGQRYGWSEVPELREEDRSRMPSYVSMAMAKPVWD